MKGRKAMNERQNYLADGFRNVDRQTDVEKFKICLTAMERLSSFRTYKEETYQLLKPGEGRVFIDVGCGLGFDVERLAKTTSAKIIGLDTSYELLGDARRRAQDLGIANADYVLADAGLHCFSDGQFDGARVDRTLQHLERPGRIIEEITRVVRKGGRVVCAEPDWGSFFIDDNDAAAVREICREWTTSFRNPFIGGELPRLMASAGLANIRTSGCLLATYGLQGVNLIYDVRKTSGILSEKHRSDSFNHWYQKLASRDPQSPVFAGVTIVIAAGLKA
jgi:ubiquinone/menaquinone biosynthesis C-methylase UbiE